MAGDISPCDAAHLNPVLTVFILQGLALVKWDKLYPHPEPRKRPSSAPCIKVALTSHANKDSTPPPPFVKTKRE